MTKKLSKPTLHEYIAIALITIGMIVSDFIQLRPNRIENGMNMGFRAAIGDLWVLIVAFFIVMIITFIAQYTKTGARLASMKTYHIIKAFMVTIALLLLIIGTALGAKDKLVDMSSAARVSVSLGFWLILIGLVLLMNRALVLLPSWMGLIALVFILTALVITYYLDILTAISFVREFKAKSDRIGAEMIRHMQLALSATFTGLALSIYLAGIAYRNPKKRGLVMSIVNMAQVIPTLTFLGLVMIPLTQLAKTFPFLKAFGISGIGFVPAYIVLTMYSLLPMTTNILAGYQSIDSNILEAAKGIGMSKKQIHQKIELPLILPYLFSGFGTALVQTTGNTILAGLVGGGGIGAILFLGLAQSAPDLVLLGALLVVSVALILKLIIGSIEPIINKKLRGEA